MINCKELFEKGMEGIVEYDENEDSYKLNRGIMGFDLCQARWDDYEGKKVLIIIKELK